MTLGGNRGHLCYKYSPLIPGALGVQMSQFKNKQKQTKEQFLFFQSQFPGQKINLLSFSPYLRDQILPLKKYIYIWESIDSYSALGWIFVQVNQVESRIVFCLIWLLCSGIDYILVVSACLSFSVRRVLYNFSSQLIYIAWCSTSLGESRSRKQL